MTLIKPQFETGRKQVGKGGVVKDPAVHRAVLRKVLLWADGHGLRMRGLMASPLKGPAGNVEFLAHLVHQELGDSRVDIETVIDNCLEEL